MLREEDIRNIEVIKPMGEEALQKEREEILSKLVEASVHIISDYVKEDHKSVESPRACQQFCTLTILSLSYWLIPTRNITAYMW